MRRDVGPWSEVFDVRHKQLSYLQRTFTFGGVVPNFNRTINTSSMGLGLYRARSGYESPSRPYVKPQSSGLTLIRAICTDYSAGKYRNPTTNNVLEWSQGEINLQWVPLLFATNKSKVDNTARMKFLSRASAGLDTYPILAEARKTGKGIARNASEIAGVIQKTFSRVPPPKWRRKSDTAKLLKQSADHWLELQFNLKPLVSDITNGLIALDDLAFFTRKKCEGTGSADERSSPILVRHVCTTPTAGSSGVSGIVTTTGDVSFTYDSKLGATWSPSPGVGTYRALKTQWQDVLPAMWELFPYSFIADYFSNLQEVIMGHSFDFTVWANLWQSRFSKIQGSFISRDEPPNGAYSIRLDGNIASSELLSITFNRDPASATDFIPKLEVGLPSLAQSANLIALSAARFIHVPKTWVRV
jgi:hypothetical protein